LVLIQGSATAPSEPTILMDMPICPATTAPQKVKRMGVKIWAVK
jgi:hypothetical protein